jgi:two-component system sensor histidine kinase UhpB
MKISSDSYQRFIMIGYLVFIILASAIFFYLFPLTGIGTNNFFKKQFLFQTIWLIISTGSFLFIVTYFLNKKLNEEKIAANETIHRYEALGNASNDAIWDYDIQTEKIFYNDRLLSIFGFTREELADNTNWWENNIHPEDKERVIQRMNTTLESGKTNWEDEYRFRCKDGNYKIVYDRSYIMRNQQNNPIRLIGAMKDVTKLRSLEQEFISQQLKNKNKLGKKIILSHENERKKIKDDLHEDVNQILASIKLYMNELKSEHPDETLTASLHYLDDAIKKIKKISNTLSSSTFEFFGLTEAVYELITNYKNEAAVTIDFNTEAFDEDNTDKEVSLLIYRIIENKLKSIIENTNTKNITIDLSNSSKQANLRMSFESDDKNIRTIQDDSAMMDITSKLEMYEGTMKIIPAANSKYTIEVIV